MIYTLKQLFTIKADRESKLAEQKRMLDGKRTELREIETKIIESVKNGNPDEYLVLTSKANDLRTLIKDFEDYFSKTSADCINRNDLIESWNKRVSEYNSALEVKTKEFNKAKEKLCSLVYEIDKMNSEMYSEKLDFMSFTGKKTDDAFKDFNHINDSMYIEAIREKEQQFASIGKRYNPSSR